MYIWRRRLQQYGPRLDKPYDFYFWVEEARREIRARGETPVELAAEPLGSEIAPPSKGPAAEAPSVPDPDPAGRIVRDPGLVRLEPSVTPGSVRPGARVRVRVAFRLDATSKAHWNNEAGGLTLSVRLPDGLRLVEGTFVHPRPGAAESQEPRILEFEAAVGDSHAPGPVEVPAYAVYDVCEDVNGVCRHLRQDLRIRFLVDPAAVPLK
jgi:hypothetical protein